MTLASIRLSSFSDTTDVNVEGLGIIKVKKESSNQGARHSEIVREIYKIQEASKQLDKKITTLLLEGKTDSDPEFVKLENKGRAFLDRISELRLEDQQLRKSRLSDDEGGKLVDILFENASDEDIAKLLSFSFLKEQNDEQSATS